MVNKGNHLNARPGITQPSVAPCVRRLIQTTNKTKIQTQSSADRITPHSALPVRGKTSKQTKLSTNLTLYEAYNDHWTNLRRTETKRKKNLTLNLGKRRPQTQ